MKMQERKLKKFAVYSKIANVLFVLVVVFNSILIAAAVGAVFFLQSADTNMASSANFFFKNVKLAASVVFPDGTATSLDIVYMAIIYRIASVALIAYIIKMVAVIFSYISKNSTPFSLKTVRFVKSIGIAFLIYEGIIILLSIITGYILTDINFVIVSKGSSLLIGLLVLLIGEIFEFGMGLQQDSESIV